MSHVAHVNESCRTCEWVTSHMWMSHDSGGAYSSSKCARRIDAKCLTHSWVWRDAFMCDTWCSHVWDMTHSYVWWLVNLCATARRKWLFLDFFLTFLTFFLFLCAMTRLRVNWVMSHIWMSHVTHMNDSCHTYERVMSHIWTSHVTHMNESCHTYEWVMSHIW